MMFLSWNRQNQDEYIVKNTEKYRKKKQIDVFILIDIYFGM